MAFVFAATTLFQAITMAMTGHPYVAVVAGIACGVNLACGIARELDR